MPKYSSSADTIKHYSDKQEIWEKESNDLIEKLGSFFSHVRETGFPPVTTLSGVSLSLDVLATETLFGKTYAAMAMIRHQLADNIGHTDHRGNVYGVLRNENYESFETITHEDISPFANQKLEILKELRELIERGDENADIKKTTFSESRRVSQYLDRAISGVMIQIKNEVPSKGNIAHYSHDLSKIELYGFPSEKDFFIKIWYTSLNKYSLSGDFKVADQYFESCIMAETKEDFLLAAGKLSHLMAHLLPVKRGNASIVDWIIRGAAKSHGIELEERKTEGIAWDLKAIITPNREKYAEWFAENAFVSVPEFPSSPGMQPRS